LVRAEAEAKEKAAKAEAEGETEMETETEGETEVETEGETEAAGRGIKAGPILCATGSGAPSVRLGGSMRESGNGSVVRNTKVTDSLFVLTDKEKESLSRRK